MKDSTSWLMMILVECYRDGVLSRTTTILGGGGCKVLRRGRGWATGESMCTTGARAGVGARAGALHDNVMKCDIMRR